MNVPYTSTGFHKCPIHNDNQPPKNYWFTPTTTSLSFAIFLIPNVAQHPTTKSFGTMGCPSIEREREKERAYPKPLQTPFQCSPHMVILTPYSISWVLRSSQLSIPFWISATLLSLICPLHMHQSTSHSWVLRSCRLSVMEMLCFNIVINLWEVVLNKSEIN